LVGIKFDKQKVRQAKSSTNKKIYKQKVRQTKNLTSKKFDSGHSQELFSCEDYKVSLALGFSPSTDSLMQTPEMTKATTTKTSHANL
jgi:hypothetical protein